MPGRRTILPPAMFTLVLIAALSSQATGAPRADDDCLAKPNGPAPEGQHWYYRIDHANKRQCWRLAEEGLPVRKAAPQPEVETESEPAPPPRTRAPQPAAAPAPAPAAAVAPAPAANPFAAPPSVPWPDVSKLPAFAPLTPQTASADDAAPVTASADPQSPAEQSSSAGDIPAERPQRPATEKTADKSPQQLPGIEHSFILLIVMFGLLAVTGPIIHFTHRQRQREVVAYKPPRWAPVLPLNETPERVRVKERAPDPAIGKRPARRVALQTDQPAWRPAPELIPGPAPTPPPRPIPAPRPAPAPSERPAPMPTSPPLNLNEELRYTLQQLVDRIQAIHPIAPDVAQGGTRRADLGMMKKAR